MPVFDKIGYYPTALTIENPAIGSEGTRDINMPVFSNNLPTLSNDGVYPYIPFDLHFSFIKTPSPTTATIQLYSIENSTTKIPPYSAFETYATFITEDTIPKFGIFHQKNILKTNPSIFTNPFESSPDWGICDIKAGDGTIILEEGTWVSTIIEDGKVNYYLNLTSNYSTNIKIKGIISFL